MNTVICRESQLGYTNDYFELVTNAKISDIQKHNLIRHRADWVDFKKLVENMKNDGFECIFSKIELPKSYDVYTKYDNFIELRYGNY